MCLVKIMFLLLFPKFLIFYIIFFVREDTHKKVFFLVDEPLRDGYTQIHPTIELRVFLQTNLSLGHDIKKRIEMQNFSHIQFKFENEYFQILSKHYS